MPNSTLPLILEPSELEKHLGDKNLLIVDLSKDETYQQAHIPGAVHLQYPRIVRIEKPVMGLLPDNATLSQVLSSIGMSNDTHVVAYDDEGGGKACRLLWTLEVLGHQHFSLLNGGLHAWSNEGHPLDNQTVAITQGQYDAHAGSTAIVDMQYVLENLEKPDLVLLDSRTVQEYSGEKCFANRGGHIPHAINLDWMLTMDQGRNLRLLPDAQLEQMLNDLGITDDKEVILYCQTHHRSSHTYILLKHLGYHNIKGYPGAWSEWGNRTDTPVER